MRVVAMILFLQCFCACSASKPPTPPADRDRASDELDILESVFRYQFEHNGAAYLAPDRYFLSLSEPGGGLRKDPPPALLDRFRGNVPPVEPVSAADPDMLFGVHRRGMKDRGVVLCLTVIRWVDENTVEVEGGYYEGSRNASENTYRAELRNGVWVVVNDTLHWIS